MPVRHMDHCLNNLKVKNMMNTSKNVLAIDLGASSGRVMLCKYHDETLDIKEIHRFTNDPVIVNHTMYWDILRLFHEIKQGLIKSKEYGTIDSLSIDTWGVDFGLLDTSGNLLENPIHYRDARTEGMKDCLFSHIPSKRVYEISGNQIMDINTVFQLTALKEKRPELLKRTDKLLMIPDLLHYFLSGTMVSEESIASTSQMFDAHKRTWSYEIMDALDLNHEMFCDIVPSGTKVGTLSDEICEELGINAIDVIASAGHDTQCAQFAAPSKCDDFLFLSCGTWSLFGTELDHPIIDETSQRLNITNEAACGNKVSFLKNIIGLWLIQESRRQWMREGKTYSFSELEQLANDAKPFQSFIDPDDSLFTPAGNLPSRIRDYCKKTNQHVPESVGEIVRCINESLALKYALVKKEIETCTKKQYDRIHMIGGGTQSALLCQMSANACGCLVYGGPVEASVYGNALIQLMALGILKDSKEARQVVIDSDHIIEYKPQDESRWKEALTTFKQIIKYE